MMPHAIQVLCAMHASAAVVADLGSRRCLAVHRVCIANIACALVMARNHGTVALMAPIHGGSGCQTRSGSRRGSGRGTRTAQKQQSVRHTLDQRPQLVERLPLLAINVDLLKAAQQFGRVGR
jgi:hypothetical protein